uniref:Glycine-rich protein n=1 Tax=Kalanchoe fedtschenkoi TaxID=63787 RepID=A0A7N0UKI5_KALFE
MAANAPPTPTTTRPATPPSTDGPVLSVINKRLRALRKKQNRIIQMEDSLAQGKALNKEQEETLRSKTVVLAQIDELEKLKQPLAAAVAEEHAFAVKKYLESEKAKEAAARVSAEEECVVVEEVKDRKEEEEDAVVGVVGDVLKLLYFGSIFDVKTQSEFTSTMLTRTHERGCCLTYDYVTDDAVDVLSEKDLDFISQLGSFLTSRPMDSSLPHMDALERCVEHAKLWLAKAEQPIGPDTSITYAGLRERLNKIMASEYFTTTPEMKAPVDVAAAAAGNYGSYQVPVQGSDVTGQSEASVAQYEHQDEGHYQGQEIGDNEYSHEEETHKEEVAGDQYEASSQQEQGYTQTELEQKQRDTEQYVQRREYQNQGYQSQRGGRGGGRRGYSTGRGFRGGSRGGGPYQNGRNPYYDQPGNYYPRNNYNGRGRGGRGPGGHGYNQYGASTRAGHPASDIGIAS